ncbi:MAG: V4R domain-containing protein [bacterium]
MKSLLCFIDDSLAERELFAEVFGADEGAFQVICTETFPEAQASIGKVGRTPDLFVLDLYFPGGNPAPLSADEIAQTVVFIDDGGDLNHAFLNLENARRRFMLLRRAYDQSLAGGLKLIEQVREAYPGVPMVSYTRKGTIEDAERARRAGARRVLQKPSGDDWEDTRAVTHHRRAELEAKFLKLIQSDPADVLSGLEWVQDAGALLYKGVRYLLIRPETIIEFQKAVEKDLGVEEVGQALYCGGHRGGSLSATHFRTQLGFSAEEIVSFMAQMGGGLGWGHFAIITLDAKRGVLEIEVFHSVFAEAYQQAEVPVCHLIRGVFAGVWEGVMQRRVLGLETRCRAVDGPGACVFLFTAATGGQIDAIT